MSQHHDHIVDTRRQEGAHDARQERVAIVERQCRFGAAHPRRASGGQHHGGNHEAML
jgi:hypothetical protein